MSLESGERMEESVSQLSAMFDGELSAAECELLSRRLARDEGLRGRWARYSLIGAAMRAEPIATVSGGFARRVVAAIDRSEAAPAHGMRRLRTAALGGLVAAGVAAVAVFVLRNEIIARNATLTASAPQPAATVAGASATLAATPASTLAVKSSQPAADSGEPASYVVPPEAAAAGQRPVPAALANDVIAHSEYSSPLARRGLLSAMVASDSSQVADAPPLAIVAEEGADAPR